MNAQNDLQKLVKGMTPKLNDGEYVFTTIDKMGSLDVSQTLCIFKEAEGLTLVIDRQVADELHLKYDFVASWITLQIHSSLGAVGLTAVFSAELAKHDISCNVIAGFYHDHIFVSAKDSIRAVEILESLARNY
jgi:hypothetical protein